MTDEQKEKQQQEEEQLQEEGQVQEVQEEQTPEGEEKIHEEHASEDQDANEENAVEEKIEEVEQDEQKQDEQKQDEPAEEEVEPTPPPPPPSPKRWFSLRVISGKERKIKERMELEIQRSGWDDIITSILVPTEKVYKIRAGKKVISERNILPGYILVEAIPQYFSGEMVQTITGMPNVIHFLGKTNPIPMQQSEANRMLGKVDESQDIGEALIEPFIVGETVKIIDGPFSEFVGDIQEVNEEKKKLKVIVKIFGRGTEVELNFIQVEKQA